MSGDFYKMFPEAWDTGTVDLTLEQEAAYLRLCHAMYRAGGPIPNSNRLLKGLFRSSHNRATKLLADLIEAGKIDLTPDGHLINERVAAVLHDRGKLSETRSAAGRNGGSKRRAEDDQTPTNTEANPEQTPSNSRPNPDQTPSNHRPTIDQASTKPEATPANPLKNNDVGEANADVGFPRGEERRAEESRVEQKRGEEEGRSEASDDDRYWRDIQAELEARERRQKPVDPPADTKPEKPFFREGIVELTSDQYDELKHSHAFLKFPRDLRQAAMGVTERHRKNTQEGKPEPWMNILIAFLGKKDRTAQEADAERKARAETAKAEATVKAEKAGAKPAGFKLY
jgi:uncharacterized protein YdaU (DUF1376 family)